MNTVLKRIHEKYKYLSPSHKSIANFLLNHHERIPHLTARELAAETMNVPSSIISFSKKLGFEGFNELKYSYMNDEKYNQTIDDEILKAFMKAEEVTKREAFKEAVRLLLEAPRIFIMAFQMSQIPAKDFYFRMRKIEPRSEEHTSELQSRENLVCRLLLEKKKKNHKSRKRLR